MAGLVQDQMHPEPDTDEQGGPSDNDADNMPEPDADERGGAPDQDEDDRYGAALAAQALSAVFTPQTLQGLIAQAKQGDLVAAAQQTIQHTLIPAAQEAAKAGVQLQPSSIKDAMEKMAIAIGAVLVQAKALPPQGLEQFVMGVAQQGGQQ